MITTQAELEAALLAGGDIEIDNSVVIDLTDTMQVTLPSQIRGGRFTRTAGPAFEITSSYVGFDGVSIQGGGTPYDNTQKLIYAHGTSTTPLTHIDMRHCWLTASAGDNIWLEWCTNSHVHRDTIESYLYSGVMVVSGDQVTVSDNAISDASLTEGVANTYGIAFTDLTNQAADRSRNCTAIGNVVSLVDWEGIDTHGGENITIVGNTILGCPRGVALVVGNATRSLAPSNCLVTGNTIDSTGARHTVLPGIFLTGVSGTSASGTIVGNQILNYPTPFAVSYWSRGETLIANNSQPFVDWTPITLGADFDANTTYPPEYMVDGNTVHLRGGVIPKSGGVAARTDIGTLANAAAWPTDLTFACFAKGSNPGAGNAQVAVTRTGGLEMLYGVGIDRYTYWLYGSYQAA